LQQNFALIREIFTKLKQQKKRKTFSESTDSS